MLVDGYETVQCLMLNDADVFEAHACTIEKSTDYFYLRYPVSCESTCAPT